MSFYKVELPFTNYDNEISFHYIYTTNQEQIPKNQLVFFQSILKKTLPKEITHESILILMKIKNIKLMKNEFFQEISCSYFPALAKAIEFLSKSGQKEVKANNSFFKDLIQIFMKQWSSFGILEENQENSETLHRFYVLQDIFREFSTEVQLFRLKDPIIELLSDFSLEKLLLFENPNQEFTIFLGDLWRFAGVSIVSDFNDIQNFYLSNNENNNKEEVWARMLVLTEGYYDKLKAIERYGFPQGKRCEALLKNVKILREKLKISMRIDVLRSSYNFEIQHSLLENAFIEKTMIQNLLKKAEVLNAKGVNEIKNDEVVWRESLNKAEMLGKSLESKELKTNLEISRRKQNKIKKNEILKKVGDINRELIWASSSNLENFLAKLCGTWMIKLDFTNISVEDIIEKEVEIKKGLIVSNSQKILVIKKSLCLKLDEEQEVWLENLNSKRFFSKNMFFKPFAYSINHNKKTPNYLELWLFFEDKGGFMNPHEFQRYYSQIKIFLKEFAKNGYVISSFTEKNWIIPKENESFSLHFFDFSFKIIQKIENSNNLDPEKCLQVFLQQNSHYKAPSDLKELSATSFFFKEPIISSILKKPSKNQLYLFDKSTITFENSSDNIIIYENDISFKGTMLPSKFQGEFLDFKKKFSFRGEFSPDFIALNGEIQELTPFSLNKSIVFDIEKFIFLNDKKISPHIKTLELDMIKQFQSIHIKYVKWIKQHFLIQKENEFEELFDFSVNMRDYRIFKIQKDSLFMRKKKSFLSTKILFFIPEISKAHIFLLESPFSIGIFDLNDPLGQKSCINPFENFPKIINSILKGVIFGFFGFRQEGIFKEFELLKGNFINSENEQVFIDLTNEETARDTRISRENGIFHGTDIFGMEIKESWLYEGEFNENSKNGSGFLMDKQGIIRFKGLFWDNFPNVGTVYFEGGRFSGNFSKGLNAHTFADNNLLIDLACIGRASFKDFELFSLQNAIIIKDNLQFTGYYKIENKKYGFSHVGNFINGIKHGYGICVFHKEKDEEIVEIKGLWNDKKCQGQRTINGIIQDTGTYEIYGKQTVRLSGFGSQKNDEDRSFFNGIFLNNRRVSGELITLDTIYMGDFHNEKYEGFGILKHPNRKIDFFGNFKAGKPHFGSIYNREKSTIEKIRLCFEEKFGLVYLQNGNELECKLCDIFDKEKFEIIKKNIYKTTGKIYFKDRKTVYEGEIMDFQADGYGILVENGVKAYEGQFSLGKFEGFGIFYENNRVSEGFWYRGKKNGIFRNSNLENWEICEYKDGILIRRISGGNSINKWLKVTV